MSQQYGIVDMHCHVLPGVDDGSRDMEESIALLKDAYQQGVRAVIATPHYSRRSQDPGRHAHQDALRVALEERAKEEIDPDFTIWLGQEAYYHEEITERIAAGFGWPMAESRYVLMEYDVGADYETIFRGLRKLCSAGWTPILAHIERFPAIRRKGGLEELRSLGTIFQMNYESLDGSMFSSEVRWCRAQVKNGVVDVLGTDMHRLDFRPPHLTGAFSWMEKHLGTEDIRRLTHDNPLRIAADEEIL